MNRQEWTHTHFASLLGIGLHTLDSYLYGKTKDVPKAVMKTALEKDSEEAPVEKYHGVHMKDIIKGWCEQANEKFEDNKTLSLMCGVSIPTITRWKNGVSRPSAMDISRAENSVVKFIAKKAEFERSTNSLFKDRAAAQATA